VRKLLPGETVRFELELKVHDDAASVREAEQSIREMQQRVTSTIHREPWSEWSG
jgi:hypothetical protein